MNLKLRIWLVRFVYGVFILSLLGNRFSMIFWGIYIDIGSESLFAGIALGIFLSSFGITKENANTIWKVSIFAIFVTIFIVIAMIFVSSTPAEVTNVLLDGALSILYFSVPLIFLPISK